MGEFTGFPAAGLTFLRGLARNNEREWFNARKDVYTDAVQDPMRALAFDVADRCAKLKLPLAPNPRQPTFRIYRDVRFSSDKTPYKTHASAVLYRNGDKTQLGVLYLHIEPKGSFVAAGFYHPERDQLAALRHRMADRAFSACVAKLGKRELALETDDTLVRLPRDFADHAGTPVEPYLKLKSLIVTRPIADALLRDAALVETIATFARDASPLYAWAWSTP